MMITRRTFLKAMAALGAGRSSLSVLSRRHSARSTALMSQFGLAQTQPYRARTYGEGAYGQGIYPRPQARVYLPIANQEED